MAKYTYLQPSREKMTISDSNPLTIVPIENEDDITQAFVENAVAPDGTKVEGFEG